MKPCPGPLPVMSPPPPLAIGPTVEHMGRHTVCIRTLLNYHDRTTHATRLSLFASPRPPLVPRRELDFSARALITYRITYCPGTPNENIPPASSLRNREYSASSFRFVIAFPYGLSVSRLSSGTHNRESSVFRACSFPFRNTSPIAEWALTSIPQFASRIRTSRLNQRPVAFRFSLRSDSLLCCRVLRLRALLASPGHAVQGEI